MTIQVMQVKKLNDTNVSYRWSLKQKFKTHNKLEFTVQASTILYSSRQYTTLGQHGANRKIFVQVAPKNWG